MARVSAEQDRLVHEVNPQAGKAVAERGEDRLPRGAPGPGGRLGDRRGQGDAARAAAQDVGEHGAIGFRVAPLPARRTLRPGQAVALLPVPQPGGRDPGAPGDLADRQHGGVARRLSFDRFASGARLSQDDDSYFISLMRP